MSVYLVRHGEAKSEHEDPSHPLTEHGITTVTAVAAFLEEHKVPVGKILHSGKTRAQQTAEILAGRLGATGALQAADNLTPTADPRIWADRLLTLEDGSMLVGHLPHLGKLASHLLCQDPEKEIITFQTGTVLCLGQDESGTWAIRWMVTPDLLQ